MIAISLTINGEQIAAQVEPRTHLADFLREHLRLTGTHVGCEHGVCGACTVLIDGVPARSCITLAAACDGRDVRSIEGFDDDPLMNDLRQAFSREHALQCGYCTPGMLITARDIVGRLPGANEARVRTELSGNLCRCTGFVGIVNAVQEVAARGGVPQAAPRPPEQRPAPVAFTPTACPAPRAAEPAQPVAAAQATRLEQAFTVAHPPERVWQTFGDLPAVAACLPGAQITAQDTNSVSGRMNVKLGPMRFSFDGAARVERHDADLRGFMRGAGSDAASRSRAKGDISYRLLPERGGAATRVEITLDYSLQGPLAQFSRSGLVKDFAARLIADFARNLDARLAGSLGPQAQPAPTQLDAGQLLWGWLWRRLRRLIGRPG